MCKRKNGSEYKNKACIYCKKEQEKSKIPML